jgi:sporulation-control protein spo0M
MASSLPSITETEFSPTTTSRSGRIVEIEFMKQGASTNARLMVGLDRYGKIAHLLVPFDSHHTTAASRK